MARRPEAGIDLTARNRMQRAFDQANRSLKGLDRTAQFATRAFTGLAGAIAVRAAFASSGNKGLGIGWEINYSLD